MGGTHAPSAFILLQAAACLTVFPSNGTRFLNRGEIDGYENCSGENTRTAGEEAREVPVLPAGRATPLRLGELVNPCFLFWGDSEELGGFNATMQSLSRILTRDVLWELPKPKETEVEPGTQVEVPKVVVN